MSPFARKQRDRMGQRADLTKGSLVDGHHPRRNARLSNAPPGPGNNRRKFVKGGTHACARGGLFISAAGELAATALSLSDVTNVAFNATSQVSYYYSPWQPSQPFHPQPRPIGTKRPFDRVHMASRPQRASLSLSLSLTFSLSLPRFFTDLWTRWFIHSVNRGAVGRFRLLFLGLQGEREEKGGTCPRLGCAWIAGSGGPCWFSTKSTAPKMGPIVLLATNR